MKGKAPSPVSPWQLLAPLTSPFAMLNFSAQLLFEFLPVNFDSLFGELLSLTFESGEENTSPADRSFSPLTTIPLIVWFPGIDGVCQSEMFGSRILCFLTLACAYENPGAEFERFPSTHVPFSMLSALIGRSSPFNGISLGNEFKPADRFVVDL